MESCDGETLPPLLLATGMSKVRKPEQQLLGIARPTEKVSNWHGPRETKYMRWRRLRREELQHEDRKDAEVADILKGIKLGRMR